MSKQVNLTTIKQMFDNGSSRKEIARELEIPFAVVQQAFKRLDLKGKRKKQVYEFIEESQETTTPQVVIANEEAELVDVKF